MGIEGAKHRTLRTIAVILHLMLGLDAEIPLFTGMTGTIPLFYILMC